MKLKKIVSLALAGILAVSMLAGCDSKGNSNSSSSSEETTPATGYSAVLGEKAADTLKKNDLDKIVTFADNADDQKALEASVLGVSDNTLAGWIKGNTLNEVKTDACAQEFKEKADLARLISNGGFFTVTTVMNTTKIGQVWVANSGYTIDQAMDKIFDTYEKNFAGLQKTGTVGGSVKVDYHYTVSVSVVNKAEASDTMLDGSVNFIAVTITRTAEVA